MEWMVLPYRRYAEFDGRSRRREYWMFVLFSLIVSIVMLGLMIAGGLDLRSDAGIDPADQQLGQMFWVGISGFTAFWLGSLVPGIALSVRRFHDRNMSGWWVLGLAVVGNMPYIGVVASLANLVITALPGTPGYNRFGADPARR